MTPRPAAAVGAAIAQQSPDMTSAHAPAGHMALPQVVKMAPNGGNGGGLSVVSAPAPMAQRRDVGSAGLAHQRAIIQQNVTYEKLGLKTGKVPVRGAGGGVAANGVRIKQMELNNSHAIVFS